MKYEMDNSWVKVKVLKLDEIGRSIHGNILEDIHGVANITTKLQISQSKSRDNVKWQKTTYQEQGRRMRKCLPRWDQHLLGGYSKAGKCRRKGQYLLTNLKKIRP